MRHRITGNLGTGLGNPNPILLDNKGTLNKAYADDVMQTFFNGDGFDYQLASDSITVGIEPAYQYEKLKLVSINKDKAKSFYHTGTAMGGYGSKILGQRREYGSYVKQTKFTKFIDKWHKVLYGPQTYNARMINESGKVLAYAKVEINGKELYFKTIRTYKDVGMKELTRSLVQILEGENVKQEIQLEGSITMPATAMSFMRDSKNAKS